MPKELIHDQDRDSNRMFDLFVGWLADGCEVQIGIQCRGEDARLGGGEYESVWASLDQAGVHRLILAVEHARARAFPDQPAAVKARRGKDSGQGEPIFAELVDGRTLT